MESPDTFTLLPLAMDPTTKSISISSTQPPSSALANELAALNALHRSLVAVESTANGTPPPPVPVNPKRSAQIGKLRESGNAEFRKGNAAQAVKLYTLAIDMALGRPVWEPSGLVREEVSSLLSNRAQAQMAQQLWAEGALDAEASVEMKKVGNAKAWWRRGKCLLEMGRLDEAETWVGQGLEFEATEQDLVSLKDEIEKKKGGGAIKV
ncbi:hypothetical protein ACEQ8H_007589 [Pleosporales sp. CAS-2024a]